MDSNAPWNKNRWLPGVLNWKQMEDLKNYGLIQNANGKLQPTDSAMDLHLTSEAYRMKRGSIKPFKKNYSEIINDTYYAEPLTKQSGYYHLSRTKCYVFKLKEKLHPAIVNSSPFYGQATAKSSIGRVDVIARLIVDGVKEYEKFNPIEITTGEMFLEITPITFDVAVKEGISLSQLRFCNGTFENSLITDKKFIKSVLNIDDNDDENNSTLAVDVSNFQIGEDRLAAAYCAKKTNENESVLELWSKDGTYSCKEFWEPVKSNEELNVKSITIKENNFYILRSLERISLPAGVCIYCRAMDETLGEMRIHYAGFVHPLFGFSRKDGKRGTPLIFEVRGHNVDVLLTQGEILARLFFYRMSQLAEEPTKKKSKKQKKQKEKTDEVAAVPYGNQELTLSKFFTAWKD